MEFIASYLECNVLTYNYKTLDPNKTREALSLGITSPSRLKALINYFNAYPLRGTKYKDFLN
jgi:hypothetical protein